MEFQKYLLFAQCALFSKFFFYDGHNVEALIGSRVTQASIEDFPYIAGLRFISNPFNATADILCTAILISFQDVLLAAHCLYEIDEDAVQVVIGSVDIGIPTAYYPGWWVTYDQWAEVRRIDNGCPYNDLGIIRLTRRVRSQIEVAELSYLTTDDLSNKLVSGAGWGETNNEFRPRMLQKSTDLRILTVAECEERATRFGGEEFHLDLNLLCSAAEPFAALMEGDSGGPVTYLNKVVAISVGACPRPDLAFSPEKLNIHMNLMFYEGFILYLINDEEF